MSQNNGADGVSEITVRLFASLREELGTPGLTFDLSAIDGEATVQKVRSKLVEEYGASWSALESDDVRIAVNQLIEEHSATLQSGDELAFFPPVTGG